MSSQRSWCCGLKLQKRRGTFRSILLSCLPKTASTTSARSFEGVRCVCFVFAYASSWFHRFWHFQLVLRRNCLFLNSILLSHHLEYPRVKSSKRLLWLLFSCCKCHLSTSETFHFLIRFRRRRSVGWSQNGSTYRKGTWSKRLYRFSSQTVQFAGNRLREIDFHCTRDHLCAQNNKPCTIKWQVRRRGCRFFSFQRVHGRKPKSVVCIKSKTAKTQVHPLWMRTLYDKFSLGDRVISVRSEPMQTSRTISSILQLQLLQLWDWRYSQNLGGGEKEDLRIFNTRVNISGSESCDRIATDAQGLIANRTQVPNKALLNGRLIGTVGAIYRVPLLRIDWDWIRLRVASCFKELLTVPVIYLKGGGICGRHTGSPFRLESLDAMQG